jgi:hypothetical protein
MGFINSTLLYYYQYNSDKQQITWFFEKHLLFIYFGLINILTGPINPDFNNGESLP